MMSSRAFHFGMGQNLILTGDHLWVLTGIILHHGDTDFAKINLWISG